MKRVATALLLSNLLLILGATAGLAQTANTSASHSSATCVANTPVFNSLIPAKTSGVAKVPMQRLSALVVEDSLAYYVNDGSATAWPVGDTIMQNGAPLISQVTGNPFVRFVNWQRFTLPRAERKPVIDSVHLVFTVDTVVGTQMTVIFTDQTIGDFKDQSGNVVASRPIPNASFKQIFLSTTRWQPRQLVDTMIKFKTTASKPVINMSDTLATANRGSFFILFSTYNPGNLATLWADSNIDQRDLDTSVDRAGYEALSFNSQGQVQDGTLAYWGGQYYSDNSQTTTYFPNFIMAAYTHDALAAVNDPSANGYSLDAIYPNPVSTSADINYTLGQNGPVSLKVYNSVGEEIASLVSGVQGQGNQSIKFDASKLTNGVYYYTLRSGEYTATRSLIVSK